MNKKMLGAVLGTLAFGTMTIARAGEEPPAGETKKDDAKGKKAKKGDKKGGEKSCGADGKSCSGKN